MFKNPKHDLMLNILGICVWPYNIQACGHRILLILYFFSLMGLFISAYRCKYGNQGS